MEITDRLKEIILQETNIDIAIRTRKREVVEVRALYCFLIKQLNPKLTFEKIGDTLGMNHSNIIHLLKNYDVYENNNQQLKNHRKEILKYFKIEEEMNTDLSFETRQLLAQINRLTESVETLKEKNNKLMLESKKDYKFDIIEKLNQLMNDTFETEKYDLIKVRLDAFYHMNKIKQETWYDESKEERMNIIGQNGNDGIHYKNK